MVLGPSSVKVWVQLSAQGEAENLIVTGLHAGAAPRQRERLQHIIAGSRAQRGGRGTPAGRSGSSLQRAAAQRIKSA